MLRRSDRERETVSVERTTPSVAVRRPRGVGPDPPPLEERDRPVTALALDLSGSCNLACRYCAEALTQPTPRPQMSDGVMDDALALLMPGGRVGSGASIRLGSGEPLLGLPRLRRLATRLAEIRERCGQAPQVFLTTNGTLAGPDVRDWLVATGWHVKVSLDGPASVHDRWRVSRRGSGTYEVVADLVADLARRMPDRLSVTAVLCRGTDPRKVFEAIEALGVRRIELVPAVHDDIGISPGPDDVAAYRAFARIWVERYVAFAAAAPSDGETRASRPADLVRLVNVARRVMGYDRTSVSCGAGRTFLGVGPMGGLYPCFRFVGVEDYRLGDLPGGLDRTRADRFRADAGRPYDRRSACRACDIAPLCGGPCFATAELNGPGDGEPFALQCAFVRIDAEAAMGLVERVRLVDPERLLDLLVLPPAAVAALDRFS